VAGCRRHSSRVWVWVAVRGKAVSRRPRRQWPELPEDSDLARFTVGVSQNT